MWKYLKNLYGYWYYWGTKIWKKTTQSNSIMWTKRDTDPKHLVDNKSMLERKVYPNTPKAETIERNYSL